jgi:hypothetical protein
VPAEVVGTVVDEVLPRGIRAGNLARGGKRGGFDRDCSGPTRGRARDVGRIGQTRHRRARGLDEHVGHRYPGS